ncbi:Holliday junction branch migration protein RuvA [Candidatus Nitrospira allomarina]|jgi:holliday junction DNA helicase RuvA|uniref:Holliday junction branch migration complex subunit RuvA n=1 Tax=Candidatus Nitrospira allomarina TaxID=3020900 RepID=A0AA96JT19_9BACT|nr:Holliday junction branch migration protein RuvA [Candidatus Nitrospira allomarina]WNM58695.1 Holliday junction branch migration protein RuvA [Candidatus Nitrospira allomarina]
MIASLSGTLFSKTPQDAVISVQGVGYHVFIALSTYFSLPEINSTVQVFVSTHLRNDTIQLFGFSTTEEKQAFSLLTTISGVGPKLALSALSTLSIRDLCTAIETGDLETLASIPGVGKKSASRIVLELKDKTNRIMLTNSHEPSPAPTEPTNFLQEEAASALINLGYRAQEVKKAMNLATAKLDEHYELEDLIRTTLKELAKG